MNDNVIFVSGHMDLSKEEFALHYEPAIRKAYVDGARFVVGDAHGCDYMTQRLLHGLETGAPKDAGRVRVFHMLERPRHNFGSGYGSRDADLPKDGWSGRRGGFELVGGFTSDEDRDAAMTQASTADIAWVRPAKDKRNSGTAKNLRRRETKERRDRIAMRATWPKYNVIPSEISDHGERFVRISSAGGRYGRDIRLSQSLVDRLLAARKAVIEARAEEENVEAEIRAEYFSQENDSVT